MLRQVKRNESNSITKIAHTLPWPRLDVELSTLNKKDIRYLSYLIKNNKVLIPQHVTYIKQQAEQKEAWALYLTALLYESQNNSVLAFKYFLESAEQGHKETQFNLGLLYLQGKEGLDKDDAKALEWFIKAANQGHKKAQFNLGLLYAQGRGGLDKDDAKALEWFIRAAEQGDKTAQSHVGFFYSQGKGGLDKDDAKALEWFIKAAEQGDKTAQLNVGVFYAQQRGGLPRDDAKALEWFIKAAKQGHKDAQYQVGDLYSQGRGGLAKDEAKALEWFKKAAKQGHKNAQYQVGDLYSQGRGGLAKDEAKALKWYMKAAVQGQEEAQKAIKEKYFSQPRFSTFITERDLDNRIHKLEKIVGKMIVNYDHNTILNTDAGYKDTSLNPEEQKFFQKLSAFAHSCLSMLKELKNPEFMIRMNNASNLPYHSFFSKASLLCHYPNLRNLVCITKEAALKAHWAYSMLFSRDHKDYLTFDQAKKLLEEQESISRKTLKSFRAKNRALEIKLANLVKFATQDAQEERQRRCKELIEHYRSLGIEFIEKASDSYSESPGKLIEQKADLEAMIRQEAEVAELWRSLFYNTERLEEELKNLVIESASIRFDLLKKKYAWL